MSKSLFSLLIFLCAWTSVQAQQVQTDADGFETFSIAEGDTVYLMKKYHLVLLKEGDNREQAEEEVSKIQMGHIEHMQKMADKGILAMAGPMGDESELRGIFIMNVPTIEEVREWVNQDPAIVSGRLISEIHPWWAAKGTKLP